MPWVLDLFVGVVAALVRVLGILAVARLDGLGDAFLLSSLCLPLSFSSFNFPLSSSFLTVSSRILSPSFLFSSLSFPITIFSGVRFPPIDFSRCILQVRLMRWLEYQK